MLVVCGSKETERQYLQALREHLRNPAVSVVVCGKACSPAQLVDYAKKQRGLSKGSFDELWLLPHFPSQTAHVATYRKLLPLLQKHVRDMTRHASASRSTATDAPTRWNRLGGSARRERRTRATRPPASGGW
ncbi:hypothetical protein ACKI16_40835 [Streptomyces scabiei]